MSKNVYLTTKYVSRQGTFTGASGGYYDSGTNASIGVYAPMDHTHTWRDISNLTLSSPFNAGQILVFNNVTSDFENKDFTFNLIDTVNISSAASNDILQFDGTDWVDQTPAQVGATIDHDVLAGLTDDDHSQYALLAGRSGDTLNIDDINETTAAHGVEIDGVLLRDGRITLSVGATADTIATSVVDNDAHLPTSGAVVDYITALNHDALVGLTDDDHSQYALLAGRSGDTLLIDDIGEVTAAHGVEIDSVLLKDGNVIVVSTRGIQWGDLDTYLYEASDDDLRLYVGNILTTKFTPTSADFYQQIEVDTIVEHTTDNGIEIDSVLLKDGGITLGTGAAVNAIQTTITDNDTSVPTSGAVVDYAADFVDTVGTLANGEVPYMSDANTIQTDSTFSFGGGIVNAGYMIKLKAPSGGGTGGTPEIGFAKLQTLDADGDVTGEMGFGSSSSNLRLQNFISGGVVEVHNCDFKLDNGATVDNIETVLTDDDTHLPTSGAVVDYVAANAINEAAGSSTEVQFRHAGDLGSDSVFTYDQTNDILKVPELHLSSELSTDTIGEYSAGAGVTIDSILLKDGGITLGTGSAVNTIETVMTDDDTHIPTSGAVIDYVNSSSFGGGISTLDGLTDTNIGSNLADGDFLQYDGVHWVNISDLSVEDNEIKLGTSPNIYRFVMRSDVLCLDKTLTATGFDGVENTDWQNRMEF